MVINKNTIIQISWIIVIGVIIWFFYNQQSTKQAAKEHQDAQVAVCRQDALQYALDTTKDLDKNPYLKSTPEQIKQTQQAFYEDYLKECYKTVSFIEEK